MARRQKYTIGDMVLKYNTDFVVRFDAENGNFGIAKSGDGTIIGKERWTTREAAVDFLAVSVMLGKDVLAWIS